MVVTVELVLMVYIYRPVEVDVSRSNGTVFARFVVAIGLEYEEDLIEMVLKADVAVVDVVSLVDHWRLLVVVVVVVQWRL